MRFFDAAVSMALLAMAGMAAADHAAMKHGHDKAHEAAKAVQIPKSCESEFKSASAVMSDCLSSWNKTAFSCMPTPTMTAPFTALPTECRTEVCQQFQQPAATCNEKIATGSCLEPLRSAQASLTEFYKSEMETGCSGVDLPKVTSPTVALHTATATSGPTTTTTAAPTGEPSKTSTGGAWPAVTPAPAFAMVAGALVAIAL